ncbi:hypothetical protein [Komagataeibacter sp. FNDCR2]|uniref:hypothetical protein n=1 Tax=Komagataeibacter sp. FNDCR2 TaxID=2878682 RepID=UPI001E5CEFA6|nr:hypothetical protein [Komagataeibacter sp. FNDCR2]MCE2574161.1 hypothetical protein [Komagataeibacter sp. FNDCR2]
MFRVADTPFRIPITAYEKCMAMRGQNKSVSSSRDWARVVLGKNQDFNTGTAAPDMTACSYQETARLNQLQPDFWLYWEDVSASVPVLSWMAAG